MTRLHVGCGSVYLSDWVNVDVPSEKTFLAAERPDLVAQYRTDESNYYACHSGQTIEKMRTGPLDQEMVCDRYGSFEALPVRPGSAREILSRQVFEHLSCSESRAALREARLALAENGILRIDVPDHEQTMLKFLDTQDRFYIRHLLGPRRSENGFHVMSFTRQRLTSLVESEGFEYVLEEPNIHLYPAFCLRFEKR